MPVAMINDLPLHYTDSGGDGPVLVLGHGFFLDSSIFTAQAAAVSPRWRVLAWDARGHGATPDTTGTPYTYWDQARDVLGLLDHLGIDKAVVGGVSQGGFTALRVALLAPDRVAGLVLWDTEATACHPEDKTGYRAMFDALAEHGPIDDLTVPLSTQLLGDSDRREAWRERWRNTALPLGSAADCLLERDDVSDRLGGIDCPVLLMWGEHDVSLPRDRMESLRDRLPGADRVHVIAGAAHTPPLTHADQVNVLLAEFLQRLEPFGSNKATSTQR
ncbi:alpha/beta hydrolase [Umezawaea sp. Da 62-37]|uniref:alpha/beta fold hydrolase n=1 Tax=Umezawaea sp. Da 62-37 TaxID=3075927 RepID=UPI0028F70096|nr:alpha/beta hydrolase [Umezawaea sp. Da 62-37]WNV87878.1 alpha/beta hydrolase [Umezawaea sp. Da 62-37]